MLSKLPPGKAFLFVAHFYHHLRSSGDTGGLFLLEGRGPSPEPQRVSEKVKGKDDITATATTGLKSIKLACGK